MEPDATNSLTNEQIARMLGWSYEGRPSQGGYFTGWWKDDTPHVGVPLYMQNVDLCLRDILPEIVRRGYWLEICYGPGNTCVRLGQVGNGNALKTYVVLGDPPPIANAICEALVRTEGQP